jgi:hypothetical protein
MPYFSEKTQYALHVLFVHAKDIPCPYQQCTYTAKGNEDWISHLNKEHKKDVYSSDTNGTVNLDDFIRKGRDTEKSVLYNALRLHLNHKVVMYKNKTAIFY